MTSPGPSTTEVNVAVLTPLYQLRGRLQYVGVLQTALNDEQRPTITMINSAVLGLLQTNPAAQMTQAEMFVSKRDCHAIAFEGMPPTGAITLLPRFERLVVYTSHFAIMGKWYMGSDSRVNDFAEAAQGLFLIASEVRIFPMFQARPGMIGAATMAVVYKRSVLAYHQAT